MRATATTGQTMRESKSERLDDVLHGFLSASPDVEAAAVVSFDGLTMASALPDGMDDDRVGAMSAALLSLGEQAARGLGRGQLEQLFVEADDGFVFLMSAKDQAVLVAVTGAGAKLGFILYEMRRAAADVGSLLEERGSVDDAAALTGFAELSHVPEPADFHDVAPQLNGHVEDHGTNGRNPFGDADFEDPFYVGAPASHQHLDREDHD